MLLTIVSATHFEIEGITTWLQNKCDKMSEGIYRHGQDTVHVLITRVGMVPTAYALGMYFALHRPHFVIHAGIAGAFDLDIALGEVFHVTSERSGDYGAEDAEGNFINFSLHGLDDPNQFPYVNGVLYNLEASGANFLPQAAGLTVQKVSGYAPHIEAMRSNFPEVKLESMEGAAFFYAAMQNHRKFIHLRAVSNHVAPRDKSTWQMGLAIANLGKVTCEILQNLLQTA